LDLRQPRLSGSPAGMEDDLLRIKLEKLLVEAEDCELISKLATDSRKRELFKKLATDLRSMARDIEARISGPPKE
jgi:hypothetical protein